MKNIEALPLNKENFKDLFIRLLMILFTVPVIVKVLNAK